MVRASMEQLWDQHTIKQLWEDIQITFWNQVTHWLNYKPFGLAEETVWSVMLVLLGQWLFSLHTINMYSWEQNAHLQQCTRIYFTFLHQRCQAKYHKPLPYQTTHQQKHIPNFNTLIHEQLQITITSCQLAREAYLFSLNVCNSTRLIIDFSSIFRYHYSSTSWTCNSLEELGMGLLCFCESKASSFPSGPNTLSSAGCYRH